jgi:hypothetical protein
MHGQQFSRAHSLRWNDAREQTEGGTSGELLSEAEHYRTRLIGATMTAARATKMIDTTHSAR